MRIAIMQPYFFPYIGYFQLMAAVDKFVVFDDVNYINKGWINRNNILAGGKPHLITLPLLEASQNKKINAIDRTSDARILGKLLKTISMNYGKAPYFVSAYQLIDEIFNSQAASIAEFNLAQLKVICRYLNIKTEIVASSSIYNNDQLKGAERIIDICRRELADEYLNPIGGVELYDREVFGRSGINLMFMKSRAIEYRQSCQNFVPWLSIIDVLMFNSIEETNEILKQYELE